MNKLIFLIISLLTMSCNQNSKSNESNHGAALNDSLQKKAPAEMDTT